MVANYADGKRRFDSYADEADALEAANKLARQMSEREVLAAALTNEQASEYAASIQKLKPFNVGLLSVADTVTQCLTVLGGGLSDLQAAAKFYRARHRTTTAKRVADVVAELLNVKERRGASQRYLQDLRYRLTKFAGDFECDVCNVTTAQVQAWLDGLKLEPQGYMNFRRVLHLFGEFAVARGYAADNPVEGVERVKVANGDAVEIYKPAEIARLLEAAPDDFKSCLALSAFAGLRSAEIERQRWEDIDLTDGHLVVTAGKVRTAGRRIVPILPNLAAWLRRYAKKSGPVWGGSHDEYYDRQQQTAAATAVEADTKKGIKAQHPVKWKPNGARHSFISYRLAATQNAAQTALEAGNSVAMVNKHYRELVKAAEAKRWFSVGPQIPGNIAALPIASGH